MMKYILNEQTTQLYIDTVSSLQTVKYCIKSCAGSAREYYDDLRVRTPPGNLEYSWIFIWNFSGPGKPGEMMLFFEI